MPVRGNILVRTEEHTPEFNPWSRSAEVRPVCGFVKAEVQPCELKNRQDGLSKSKTAVRTVANIERGKKNFVGLDL